MLDRRAALWRSRVPGGGRVCDSQIGTSQATGVLYISYDGMLEPLGQSQVLAYLERLAGEWPIHLISFEKTADWRDGLARAVLTRRIEKAGIAWHPLRYHKRPSAPATIWDIAHGIALGTRLARQHGLSIAHARSYVPSAMALAIKRLTGARFIFDMRGFWADERVDAGLWPRKGRLYRLAKGFEKRFLLAADAVVSLTHAGKREIECFDYLHGRVPPIIVIPTCADLDRFAPRTERADGPFVLGYVGSTRTWYLFDEFLRCFKALKELVPEARLLILNRNEHDFIRARVADLGVEAKDVELRSANHESMPGWIGKMTAAGALIAPFYSKIASAPTKLAEQLGCGVPCLGNDRIGDVTQILEEERVGVVLRQFDDQSRRDAMQRLIALTKEPDITQRCVAAARRHFSLDAGVNNYSGLYWRLSAANAA